MHEDIVAFSEHKVTAPFVINLCGISYCDGSYKIDRRKSKVWRIEYIIKGEGYVNVDDKSFTASKGDIYMLPSGKRHYYYSDADDPWEKIWFNVRGDLVESIMEIYKLSDTYIIHGLNIYHLFYEFIETARKATSPAEAYKKCSMCFLNIIQTISAYKYSSQNINKQNCAQVLKKKLDSITRYDIEFDILIKNLNYSKSHIIRAFKKEYNISPYEYLLEKKIGVAKNMLLDTAIDIKEIAYFLGFQDNHYFSTFFKKRTGLSPRNYRISKTINQK